MRTDLASWFRRDSLHIWTQTRLTDRAKRLLNALAAAIDAFAGTARSEINEGHKADSELPAS